MSSVKYVRLITRYMCSANGQRNAYKFVSNVFIIIVIVLLDARTLKRARSPAHFIFFPYADDVVVDSEIIITHLFIYHRFLTNFLDLMTSHTETSNMTMQTKTTTETH